MKTFKQFYEEMMVANAPGTSGGFGQNAPAKGPVAGKECPMGKMKRRKKLLLIN